VPHFSAASVQENAGRADAVPSFTVDEPLLAQHFGEGARSTKTTGGGHADYTASSDF
jgi:hypothetical protein